MAKHITIKVPGKYPQTGELTTFELKGQRMDIDIGGQAVPFLIHGRGIGTSLTHIPSGYRIALLGGWLTARYAIPENKPSRTTCAQMAIDRLVAQYGSQHLLDRLNCKPVINETGLIALVDAPPSHSSTSSIKGQPSQAGPWHHWSYRT